MRQRLNEGIPIRPNLRRLIMIAVMLAFSGLYLLIGPSGKATEPDPGGTTTGGTPTAVCSEVGEVAEDGTCVVDGDKVANAVEKNRVAGNLTWLIVAGALVFFMQAGFAMVETGFCRKKNAAHVVMTNYLVFGVAALAFALVGYSFMFGGLADLPIIGFKQFGEPVTVGGWNIWSGGGWALGGSAYDVGVLAFFFFQLVFMDTMATIPTGAMAERWKFSAFLVFAFVAGAFIYPIIGNWVWGGGWLSQIGVKWGLGNGALDFAGSGVVHAVGGITGLMGAIVLGPRLGKFNKDGTPNALPAHSVPMGIFGTIILFFGWIGFNGGSTFASADFRFAVIIANTMIAGCAGMVVALLVTKALFKKYDPSMAANGGLAGLVAITAPCAFTSPRWSFVIGAVAGALVVGSILFIERRMKVDDPVGAVSVHGVCGIWGLLALGIFADGNYSFGFASEASLEAGTLDPVKGLVTGSFGQFAAQLVYALVLIVVIGTVTFLFFKIQDAIQGIRAPEDEQLEGLDVPEMGVEAYAPEPGLVGGHAPAGASASYAMADVDVAVPRRSTP